MKSVDKFDHFYYILKFIILSFCCFLACVTLYVIEKFKDRNFLKRF